MAIGPIDYTTQVASPFAAAAQGYQFGSAIRQDQAAQQQAEAAQAQRAQMQADLNALVSNPAPTVQDYTRIATLYPQLAESAMKSWSAMNEGQQQAELGRRSKIFAALQSGASEVARKLMTDEAALMRAAGAERQATEYETMEKIIEQAPEFAQRSIGVWLGAVPGGDKVLSASTSLRDQARADAKLPGEVKKIDAEATQATTEAAIASVTAPAVIAEAELKPQQIAAGMANQAAQQRIAELNVQIAQEQAKTQRGQLSLDIDKLTLERDKLVQEQAKAAAGKGAEAQNEMDSLTQTIATAERIMKHPGLEGFFYGAGTIGQRMAAYFPGTDSKDFRQAIETLKSQQFLAQVPQMKGLGALTEAEGSRLEKAIASIDPDQSQATLKNNLGIIVTTMEKARSKLAASGKLPTAGGAFVMTHPQFGKVTEGDINRLLAKHPGSTREQVITYLRGTGGK